MVRASGLALTAALLSAGLARGADQPLYQPPPAWVTPVRIPDKVKPSGAASDVLLWTVQSRLTPGGMSQFTEMATRINASEGLQDAGNLIQRWDPTTETLAIHRAAIIRNGRVIDLLQGGERFTVLRRETGLEAAMLDGELTATLQPEGLQVGDVVDLAVTLTRREPAFAKHSEFDVSVNHTGEVGRLVITTSWPAEMSARLWTSDDLPKLTRVTDNGWTQARLDLTAAISPDAPEHASSFDQIVGVLEASDYASWREVSSTLSPLYDKAATINVGSHLEAEVARIRAAAPDAKGRALLALKLVEDQTRYFFVGLDAGGFTPAPADLTWTRRFGDCKGKSVLLTALLRRLEIKAEPALVDTSDGDGLDKELPRVASFDHVIVRAQIDGRTYWLDATRNGDEDLDVLTPPDYHWALPLQAGGADLERLRPSDPQLPLGDIVFRADARGGLAVPAVIHEDLILRRDAALSVATLMKQASRADADKVLRRMLTQNKDWITPEKVDFTYDPHSMTARASLDGRGKLPFNKLDYDGKTALSWVVEGSTLASPQDMVRRSDYHRNADYQVAYPAYTRVLVQVQLPDGGKDFEPENSEEVSETVGEVSYSRFAAVSDGRFTMTLSRHAQADRFPAAQAAQAEVELRRLAYRPVVLVHVKGLEGDQTASTTHQASAPSTEAPPSSVDPDSAYRRKDYAAAEKGFSDQIKAAPSAKLYYNRAVVHAARGEAALAEVDLNAALKLDPGYPLALYAFGRLDLERGDETAAAEHFKAAAHYGPETAKLIAMAYETVGRYKAASAYWDQIATSPSSSLDVRASALNAGCWTRAEGGVELNLALKNCNEALKLKPDAASYLNSRGLVDLRMGAYEKAFQDYDQALTRYPKLATSLFGRGVAEAKLGRAAQAEADFAAADRLQAGVAFDFARWGVPRPSSAADRSAKS